MTIHKFNAFIANARQCRKIITSMYSIVITIFFFINYRVKMSKSVTPVDKYTCKLSKELQKLAENELRETKSTRNEALKVLRDWIQSNPRIELTRMDANFLLQFLRAKKFSVKMAQDNLERFILLRQRLESNEHIFQNMDYRLPKVEKLLNLG